MKSKYDIILPGFRFIFDGMGLVFPGGILFFARVFVFGILLDAIWLWHKHQHIFPSSACNQPSSSRIRSHLYGRAPVVGSSVWNQIWRRNLRYKWIIHSKRNTELVAICNLTGCFSWNLLGLLTPSYKKGLAALKAFVCFFGWRLIPSLSQLSLSGCLHLMFLGLILFIIEVNSMESENTFCLNSWMNLLFSWISI